MGEGEIDTRPIESVQVALSVFGQKGDKSTTSDDIEGLLKDLANIRLQLEAKDFSYKQALLKLEHYHKLSDELSTLLKQSEFDREKCLEQYSEAKTRIDELELKMKEMGHQLLESANIREQLLHVLNELKAAQEELLCTETELAAARESVLRAVTQAELMESEASIEKEKAEELLRCVVSEKAQAQEQIKDLKAEMGCVMEELEIQLLEKCIYSDLLLLELRQSNQLLGSSEKAAFDAFSDLKQLKENTEVEEGEIFDRAIHMEALEMELSILKLELKNADEEKGRLMSNTGMLKVETKNEERKDESITLSAEEYELLIKKAEKADENPPLSVKDSNQPEGNYESEILKKELEITTAKVGELRNRLEQAVTRAEAAEKAKAALANQIRRWQEQRQKRKAALVALKEVSEHKQQIFPTYEQIPATYQPLGKVLNMKF